MLIEFIGAPCSGKTTTAAGVFSKLKEEGTAAEFISEQARHYIAGLRYDRTMKPHESVVLTDDDQQQIMERQLSHEEVMTYSCPEHGVVVSDTSPLAALLYMSDKARAGWMAQAILEEWSDLKVNILFYAQPVARSSVVDPNRVHSLEESLRMDKEIPALLAKYAPTVTPIPLYGDSEHRLALAMSEIAEWRGRAIG